ncbi:Adiponectin receptor protein 1 [Heterocephalus glaber]|uniref:Adiponectin receptor protein 1 n=1 Tax=Heterocephalus glaber TaxID=10181 RepID=G5BLA7_HETGA|nr:Adiponectin receptor protein 1 [Heterocephalus glaber]
MSSHKGSVAAQDTGTPANNRETDTVELAELGPLLQEKAKQVIANPTKAEDEPTCPVPQEEEEEVWVLPLPPAGPPCYGEDGRVAYKVWERRWRGIPYDVLPDWLKDNDDLSHGHRPPMPSFRACFKSIFCIHTETGNIWTHLLGFVLFLFLGILTMLQPNMYFMAPLQEKPQLIYLSTVCVLGISASTVAQWDRFATPKHRQTGAVGQMGWFFLVAVTYITGAGLYAVRIPERFFPGKFDIWFQSHQILHVPVVAVAFVYFYRVSNLQEFRYSLEGSCT